MWPYINASMLEIIEAPTVHPSRTVPQSGGLTVMDPGLTERFADHSCGAIRRLPPKSSMFGT